MSELNLSGSKGEQADILRYLEELDARASDQLHEGPLPVGSEMKVTLPRTFQALNAGEMNTLLQVLEDELCNMLYDLFDSNIDSTGGGTDEESVEVQQIRETEDGVEALILFSYEQLTPSGCSDMPHRTDASYSMILRLRRGATEADMENPSEDWDISDRNSARDGN